MDVDEDKKKKKDESADDASPSKTEENKEVKPDTNDKSEENNGEEVRRVDSIENDSIFISNLQRQTDRQGVYNYIFTKKKKK